MLEVSICTDSIDEAIELEAALKLLQRRTYPDIMALSAAFATYLEMYEQAKVDQIAACTEFSSLHTAIQVPHKSSPCYPSAERQARDGFEKMPPLWHKIKLFSLHIAVSACQVDQLTFQAKATAGTSVQEGQASEAVSHRLQQLRNSVEDSRSGVIDAHRALLDLTDSSVGRVCSQEPTPCSCACSRWKHTRAELPATCHQFLTSPLPYGRNIGPACCGLPENMPREFRPLLPSLPHTELNCHAAGHHACGV